MRETSFTQKLSRSLASRRLRVAIAVSGSVMAAAAAAPAVSQAKPPFVPQTPSLATIAGTQSNPAPWNEWQGDEGSSEQLSALGVVDPAQVLPTYEPEPGSTALPNVSVFDGSNPTDSDTSTPYESGTVGTPGPLAGYCGSGDWDAESGFSGTTPTPSTQPAGLSLPAGPYYFPHIVLNADGSLTGYFDYRPKDEDEAVVAATSTDGGKDWAFDDEALEQNAGYCASSDVNDDGQGHPNVLNLGGSTSGGDVTSGGTNELYTLQRPAGDNAGVGMLVHSLSSASASHPLADLPESQSVGVDPDSFDADSSAVTVPTQASGNTATLTVQNTGSYGQVDALVPGGFVDLGQSGTSTASNSSAADAIDCTGVTASTAASDTALGSPSSPAQGTPGQLTGCSVAGPSSITVNPRDMIEQVLGYTSTKSGNTKASTTEWSVPAGPNTETGESAVGANKGKFYISPTPSTTSVGFTYELTGITLNINAPNRVYVDGDAAYCSQSNNNPTTEVENCTAGAGAGAWNAAQGQPILTDPIVPAASEMTSGLDAPDGIVGELHSFPTDGSFKVPSSATYVMYTEKLLDYYVAGETNGDTDASLNSADDPTFGTAGATAPFDISFDPWQYLPEDLASQITTSGSGANETFGAGSNGITITMGDQTTGDYLTIKCTAATTGSSSAPSGANGSALVAVGSTDWMTGCTITGATTSAGVAVPSGQLASFYGDDLAKNSMLAAPGAALDNPAQLQQQGEGKSASDPTESSKLYGNNEDYAMIRVAWTTDGLNFYAAGLKNGGLISGSDTGSVASSTGATGSCAADTSYTDLTNPDQQCNPTDASGNVDLNKYAVPGTADATEMRWPGSAGTIIYNAATGEDELFLSGAWGGDGDSDAFNQVWYATSKDGLSWSVPTSVVSTDYSFSASAAQNEALAAGTDQPLGISAYYSGRAYGPSVVPNPNGGGFEMIFAGYRIPKGSGSVGDVLGTNAGDLYKIGNGGNGDDPSSYRNILVDELDQSTAAAISFGAPSGPAVYGGSATLSATGPSNEPITFAVDSSSSPSVCTVNGSTVHFVGVGSCVIDASQPAGDGYAAAGTQSVTIKVTQAPLKVIAPSVTITYGQPVPALHPTYRGLVNGDTATTVSAKCTAAYTRAGTSAITCSGVADPNYAVTYTRGVLTVDRAATMTALNVAFEELGHDDNEPVATVTVASGQLNVPGVIVLYDNGKAIATAALERGKATVTLAELRSGVQMLHAAYRGSDDFTASTSRTVEVTVAPARSQRPYYEQDHRSEPDHYNEPEHHKNR